ncbi:glycosyltransferase, partial [Candidatus Woesearchaeota archaeon]|nr:glycosyltransferase [Candidatus Woesearchaeota archaeon]
MENSDLKPKLLIVTDTYYPKVDGTLKFIEEFIKRADQDFEISLLVPYLGIKKSIGNQVNITYLDISNLWHISDYPSIKLSSSNLKKIKNVIKEADIVFIQGPALASYLGIYYSHRYHKKTILYTHTIAWELFEKFFPELLKKLFSGLIRKISIFIYNRCDEILIPYHDLKLQLSEQGIKTEMVIARLGVDTEKFSPLLEKNLAKLKLGISPEKM